MRVGIGLGPVRLGVLLGHVQGRRRERGLTSGAEMIEREEREGAR